MSKGKENVEKQKEIVYSKQIFKGYTHRFIIKFKIYTDDEEFEIENDTYHTVSINIYSTSGSYQDLENFIILKKSKKVISFNIVHRATKHEDDLIEELLNEMN